jgi:hypothetical protein
MALTARPIRPCDLCTVSNADAVRQLAEPGFVFSMSEQFTSYRTVRYGGDPLRGTILNDAFRETSISHVVPAYNFSSVFGVSLNVPIVHHDFSRFELQPTAIVTEKGSTWGLGDVSLIGRWTAFHWGGMKSSLVFNVLGGVKFPTGDSDRIQDEVQRGEAFTRIFGGNGHQHEVGGVHEHDLTLGSGSFDGLVGVSLSARHGRWFLSGLGQYYWRTEGEASFKFGNEWMINGGPGVFVLLDEQYTLSLQANCGYDSLARDDFLGSKSNNTGMTAWYLGPLVTMTWGEHFSANAGVDLPLSITSNGLQNVPDYRVHAGMTWRF